jgi:hypothetical protein
MGYFAYPRNDSDPDREQGWNEVVAQIKAWPSNFRTRLAGIEHHLEAKALYAFTMSRRLVCATHAVGGDDLQRWPLVYVETYILLFPMIELIGKAVHERNNPSSDERLVAGLRWLNNPSVLPPDHSVRDNAPLNNLKHIDQNLSKPTVSDLVLIRNYLLHGVTGHTGEPWAMNYQHPRAMAIQAEIAVREYWGQLQRDSSSNRWMARLAQADIKPFPIPGSNLPGEPSFEKCLIDPDIVEYLTDMTKSCFAVNRS